MDEAINPLLINNIINQNAFYIDLRDPHQFNQHHINHFINIPSEDFSSHLHLLPKDKPIYLLCYSGRSAKKLSSQLRKVGYLSFYIEGGFQAIINLSKNQYY